MQIFSYKNNNNNNNNKKTLLSGVCGVHCMSPKSHNSYVFLKRMLHILISLHKYTLISKYSPTLSFIYFFFFSLKKIYSPDH